MTAGDSQIGNTQMYAFFLKKQERNEIIFFNTESEIDLLPALAEKAKNHGRENTNNNSTTDVLIKRDSSKICQTQIEKYRSNPPTNNNSKLLFKCCSILI